MMQKMQVTCRQLEVIGRELSLSCTIHPDNVERQSGQISLRHGALLPPGHDEDQTAAVLADMQTKTNAISCGTDRT